MMQSGETALDGAIRNKHIEVANILRNAPPKTEVKVRIKVSRLQYFWLYCDIGTGGARGAGAPLKFHASICDLQAPGNARIITCTYIHMCACDGAP